MESFANILVGTDFSDESEHAIRTGIELSVLSKRSLHVVHAVPDSLRDAAGSDSAASRDEIQSALSDRVWEAAGAMGSRFEEELKLSVHVHFGRPDAVVCKVAETVEPDLVVLGRHGRHALEHLFLGSTTAKVARAINAPILITRSSKSVKQRYSQVLAAIDLGDLSERVIAASAAFCRLSNAQLHMLHVYESLALYEYTSLTPNVPTARYDQEMAEAARERLEELAAAAELDDLVVSTYVRPGVPAGELLYQAERMKADLIVVGTHQRQGIDRVIIGNTADRLMRRSPCDMLIVKG